MKRVVRIGLVGCGVVGTGVVQALQLSGAGEEMTGRTVFGHHSEVEIVVTHIAVRDITRSRAAFIEKSKLVNDWRLVCESDDVDLVIEVMGGIDTAHDVVRHALENGKSVVTANKALMALHGRDLRSLAHRNGLQLRDEASVLGGIPALHTIQTYFRYNRLIALRGIVNGTCNYILTQMYEQGTDFNEALERAQAFGYAEPDPSSDIEGMDAFYKLLILLRSIGADVSGLIRDHIAPNGVAPNANSLSNTPSPFAELASDVKGISHIPREMIAEAKESGHKVKHIVSARWNEASNTFQCTVQPECIAATDPLYFVDGVNNGLLLRGDVVGDIMLTGPGAGALPTASAVLEDVVQIVEQSIS